MWTRISTSLLSLFFILTLAGCGSAPHAPSGARFGADAFRNEREATPAGREVGMYALMLLQTGYRFGGKNPSAGLDCSGLVSHVYREAAGMRLAGNAATLAQQGKEVAPDQLRTGDLVFFNTLNRPFSHVGIYLGNGEFVHAPNARGRVRVDRLTERYWSQRFEVARTLVNPL
jgi:cell wall-associated NlpC family hydrolase